jgi:hypothetical protein
MDAGLDAIDKELSLLLGWINTNSTAAQFCYRNVIDAQVQGAGTEAVVTAVVPSKNVAVSVNVAPSVNRPTLSDANILKLPPCTT